MTVHVFCHIEKAGGTGIVQALRQVFGVRHCDLIPFANRSQLASARDLRLAIRTTPGLRSVAAHSIRPHQPDWDDFDLTWSTLLREPGARYISDYRHFVRHLSFPRDFELWLDWTERHDFQCRALGGTADVQSALDAVRNRDVIVGHLDELDLFRQRVFTALGVDLQTGAGAPRTVNKAPSDGIDVADLFERYGDRIRAANANDHALIGRLREDEPAQGRAGRLRAVVPDHRREKLNRAWRAVVYKPVTLQNPMRGHGLIDYREGKARSDAEWRSYVASTAAID